MAYPHRNPDAGMNTGPLDGPADLDAFLLEDDADEFLDREVAAIRESLAEMRDF